MVDFLDAFAENLSATLFITVEDGTPTPAYGGQSLKISVGYSPEERRDPTGHS
jgi:hypothetical protein